MCAVSRVSADGEVCIRAGDGGDLTQRGRKGLNGSGMVRVTDMDKN